MMNHARAAAFTLIELLFVVAVIAILAAIAVPNFLEAQTRAKISRVRADIDVLSMGLARYYSDHGTYPPNTAEVQAYLRAALDEPMPETLRDRHTSSGLVEDDSLDFALLTGDERSSQAESAPFYGVTSNDSALNRLTTPFAYLHAIPQADNFDTFSNRERETLMYINVYDVFAGDTATTHPGLWGDHLTSSTFTVLGSRGPDREFNFWHPVSGPWIPYDVTNGTVSDGDILKFEGARPKGDPGNAKYNTANDPGATLTPGLI